MAYNGGTKMNLENLFIHIISKGKKDNTYNTYMDYKRK